ncbi:MAG TPA: FliA/WhiG family RNA polymerase sigma factor [Planctomycetota bacterium]|nr:FliA/WhiG family RNA polymerase sigma factor [Planctomycetota bacterium]
MSVKKQSRSLPARKTSKTRSSTPAPALPKRGSKGQSGTPNKPSMTLKTARAGTAPTKKPVTAKPAATKSGSPKSAGTSAGKPTEKTTEKSAKLGAKAQAKSAQKKAPVVKKQPTLEELKAMQTEDVWALYRKARKANDDPAWNELLRNALLELHYPLVRHIAERLLQTLPKSIELDDLISAGVFGLMDAIRGFDPDRGIKFKTYCTTRIRGSILDQLRSQDWVPRLVRLKAGRIEKAFQKLRGEYGREPTHAELATYLKMDHEELITEIDESRARQITSINERWNEHDDDSSMEKIDIVEDQTSVDPIKEMNKRDMLKYITRSLTHKEQFIIEQYYQIGHTMREIGEMLALTESRVCQIHSNVMSRLKALLGPKSGGLIS